MIPFLIHGDGPSDYKAIPEDIAQDRDAQRDMERLRHEDPINQESAEGSRGQATSIAPAASVAPVAAAPHSARKCNGCGRLGHRRTTHADCLVSRYRMIVAESLPPNPSTVPVAPVAHTAPAASVAFTGRCVFGNGMAVIKEQDLESHYHYKGIYLKKPVFAYGEHVTIS